MKLLKYIGAVLIAGAMTACSIEEVYKTQLDQDAVYNTIEGYNGLVNACYENLYYMYGKEDGIPMMEMGDLWQNGSSTGGNWKECVNNYDWNTETNVNKTIWNALYATVAYCNTAIYYKDHCQATDSISINAKAAEAYFLRGFSYFHIVEQWGGVTLTTSSMAEDGAREFAYRNTEEEIYDQIMSDLNYAYYNLPASQGEERGRANKYTAAAMLVKAWMQRTRLERDFAENPKGELWASIVTDSTAVKYTSKQCADSAFKYAEIIINESPYKLYPSDETSGSNKCWDGENNKNNSEFIMVEAIDHENGYNPEAWNRGRARQYYLMRIGSQASEFGVSGTGLRYGRANTTRVAPTLYLLNDCFDPKPGRKDVANTIYVDNKERETTPDTRFDDTFYYKYFISTAKHIVPMDLLERVGKDVEYMKKSPTRYTITGNIATGEQLKAQYPGTNYYADNGAQVASAIFELENKPAALGCYTPNFPVDSLWCSQKKYLVAGLPVLENNAATLADGSPVNPGRFAYMQANGATAKDSYYRSLTPSFKKLSPIKYIYTNQQCMNDFPIIRLTDIYLLAAEATIISGNAKGKGLEYLNTVRKHAAIAEDADRITVGAEALTIDYLAKERARELCGENWRWYDLKRMGLLTAEYLNGPRRNVYGQPYQLKWRVRPIPQQLLDQIANPEEYGTNGY